MSRVRARHKASVRLFSYPFGHRSDKMKRIVAIVVLISGISFGATQRIAVLFHQLLVVTR